MSVTLLAPVLRSLPGYQPLLLMQPMANHGFIMFLATLQTHLPMFYVYSQLHIFFYMFWDLQTQSQKLNA